MRISDWSSDVCSSDLGSDDAQSSIAAYVHPRTRVDRARNVERQAVGALQNGRSGVQELHGDALKAGAAPVRQGNTALERIGQLRRNIARRTEERRIGKARDSKTRSWGCPIN